MRIKNKKNLSLLLLLGIMSCTNNIPLSNVTNQSNVELVSNVSNELKIDVGRGKKGASVYVQIGSGFNTKANTDGVSAKKPTDIKKFMLYFIKHNSATYTGTDPLNTTELVTTQPMTLTVNGASTKTIKFENVPPSGVDTNNGNAPYYYFVALRELDANNNELIKPNLNWTGTTADAPYNRQVAISSSGINVNDNLEVSSKTPLSITADLLDAAGAKLQTNVNINDGIDNISGGIGFNKSLNINGEFKANTYQTSTQKNPSVAVDSDGDFVVTWQSYGQDGSGNGIYGQRYDKAGTTQGNEFQVNTAISGNQVNPSVAMDSDGDFVVTWQSYGQDGSRYEVYAQRYDSSGGPKGTEFQVNTYTTNSQINPSVAMDSDGDFVVTWQSYGQDVYGNGIYGQRYDKAGNPIGVTEFKVNTITINNQNNPSVAMDSDGDFVVTWQSSDGSGYGVYGQKYDSSGGLKGTEFQVNTTTSGNQINPSVAMDSDGDFVVTWQSSDGSGYGVYGQKYDSSGGLKGTEFQVNTTTDSDQVNPSVALDSDGDFVVTWQSVSKYGEVFGQRYDSSGGLKGTEFKVNTTTASSQSNPSVAMDSDGNFVVTWQSKYGEVYGQRYRNNGSAR